MPCSQADIKRFEDGLDGYPQKWQTLGEFNAVLREEKEAFLRLRAAKEQAESKRWLEEKEAEKKTEEANARFARDLSEAKWSREEKKGWTLDLEPFGAPTRGRSRSRSIGKLQRSLEKLQLGDDEFSEWEKLQLGDDEFSEWSIEANPWNCNCESECSRGRALSRGDRTTSFKRIREWSQETCRRNLEHMALETSMTNCIQNCN
jgi:hypothetical protein